VSWYTVTAIRRDQTQQLIFDGAGTLDAARSHANGAFSREPFAKVYILRGKSLGRLVETLDGPRNYRLCGWCNSAPCCCGAKNRAED
jgi:hypothetical protein